MDCCNDTLKSVIELQCKLLLQAEQSENWVSVFIDILSLIMAILGVLATIATVRITYQAFLFAKEEYQLHKRVRTSEILSTYNNRYSTDQHIENVLKYFNCPLNYVEITLIDKEMFLRFFEELQYSIEQEGLSEEIVYDMFAYYALEADKMGTAFVRDYNEECWSRFRKFACRMKKIKEQRIRIEKRSKH